MASRVNDQSQASSNGLKGKVLTLDTMNPCVRRVEYAVRGPIVQRALELEQELRQVWPWATCCPSAKLVLLNWSPAQWSVGQQQ